MRTRTFLVLTAASAALGATAGCTSSGAVRTSTGAIATPTATVIVTPPPTNTAAPPPGGSQPCAARDLTVSQLPGTQDTAVFALTDTGTGACTLDGYPVFTLTAHSASMQTDVDVTPALQHHQSSAAPFGGTPTTVSLNPGDRAAFLVRFSIVDSAGDPSCDVPTKLHLKAPGGGTLVSPVTRVLACGEPMNVSPYLAASALRI